MASISKKGERKYLIRVSRGTGANREFVNKTFRGTLAEARAEARKLETEVDRGALTGSALTFEAAVEQWLKAIKNKIAYRTHQTYGSYIKNYSTPLNPIPLQNIKAFDIQKILNDIPLSATTVRHAHRVLTTFFNYMVRKEVLNSNPCKNVDLPQRRRAEISVLSIEEAALFIKQCQKAKNGLIFEFALETGMRPGEYLALRWRDVDFHNNTVSVVQSVVWHRSEGGYHFKPPKTPKSRRLIPISQNLRNRLVEHRRTQNEHRLASRLPYEALDLVFGNGVGMPFDLTAISRRYFKPIIDSLGVDITLYSLRHTCATLLLTLGENPKVVADRLGHSSVTLTLDTYSHVLPTIQKEATNKLDNVLRIGAHKMHR